jgi:hypothetical protein
MNETITGFVCTGGWIEIVEHGERVTTALLKIRPEIADDPDFDRWDSWRPKADERLKYDVKWKTADEACIGEGEGERNHVSPIEDVRSAQSRAADIMREAKNGHPRSAVSAWEDSLDYTTRAADTSFRKSLRLIERSLYAHIMTLISPYYFDTALIQGNLSRSRNDSGKQYRFEINISDDELRNDLSTVLGEFDEDIKRWHVSTPANLDVMEAAEGCPVTDKEREETDSRDVHTEVNTCQDSGNSYSE